MASDNSLSFRLARVAHLSLLLLLASCGPVDAPPPEGGGLGLRPGAEGIDISHHNGPIDWPLATTQGLDFVYIKATEGTGHVDARFQENWRSAVRHGWLVGAYHFYLLCHDGAAQAENFIRQVAPMPGALPPAVDLEHAHNCAPRGTREEALADLRIFLARLKAEYGAVPVIYTTPAFHAEWLAGGDFNAHPFWIRSLGGPPHLPHTLWQYSMRGRVTGIEGDVDLNRAAQ